MVVSSHAGDLAVYMVVSMVVSYVYDCNILVSAVQCTCVRVL